MWRANAKTKIEDTGTKIEEYRSQIASGKTVPFSNIIDLHNQLLKTDAAIPPDLEEHGLLQIFQDEKLRTPAMAQRLADLMTNQCKSLPDDLQQYLGPISTPVPTIIAPSAKALSSEVAPSPAAPKKAPREASHADDIAALELAYARENLWTDQNIKALKTMPSLSKSQVYSAVTGNLGGAWSDALQIYFDEVRLAEAESALTAVESGDRMAMQHDETFAKALVASAWKRRIPFDIVAQVLRCAESPEDGGLYSQAKHLCFRRLVHWHDVGALIALISRRRYGSVKFASTAKVDQHAAQMQSDGTTTFEPFLTQKQLGEVYDYFLRRPTYSGHTAENRLDSIQRYVGYGAEAFSYGSYSLADAVEAPHLLELSIHPTLLEVGRRHLGSTPLLLKIFALWDFPNTSHLVPDGVTIGDYHRDLNDFGMFWVYMYIGDVDMDCGPHALIPRSHQFNFVSQRFKEATAGGANIPYMDRSMTAFDLFDGYGYQIPHQLKIKLFENDQKFFLGPPGTIFASNGLQIHKIHQPQKKRRLMVAFRYQVTMSPRVSPMRECDMVPEFVVQHRVPNDPATKTVLGTIIRWDEKADIRHRIDG